MGWERLFLGGGVILKTTDTVNILARAWFTLKHCSPAWMMGLGPGCPRVFPPSEQGPPLLHICSFPVSLGSFLGMKCIPVAGLTSQLTTKYGCGFDLTPPPPGLPETLPLTKDLGPKATGFSWLCHQIIVLGPSAQPLAKSLEDGNPARGLCNRVLQTPSCST